MQKHSLFPGTRNSNVRVSYKRRKSAGRSKILSDEICRILVSSSVSLPRHG